MNITETQRNIELEVKKAYTKKILTSWPTRKIDIPPKKTGVKVSNFNFPCNGKKWALTENKIVIRKFDDYEEAEEALEGYKEWHKSEGRSPELDIRLITILEDKK